MKHLNHLTIKVKLKFVYVTAMNVSLRWQVSVTDLLPDLMYKEEMSDLSIFLLVLFEFSMSDESYQISRINMKLLYILTHGEIKLKKEQYLESSPAV
jgi:hypothetical protein